MPTPNHSVNEPELRDKINHELTIALERHTLGMGTAQQYLADRLASGTMADWIWKSDVSPNQERRYPEPQTSRDVAELIATAAANFARNKPGAESDMNELAIGPQAREIRANTLLELRHFLQRRASGR